MKFYFAKRIFKNNSLTSKLALSGYQL